MVNTTALKKESKTVKNKLKKNRVLGNVRAPTGKHQEKTVEKEKRGGAFQGIGEGDGGQKCIIPQRQ